MKPPLSLALSNISFCFLKTLTPPWHGYPNSELPPPLLLHPPSTHSDVGSEISDQPLLPERGVQWVLIGEPGVKRHSYAERLSKLLGIPHISMGSLIRQELDPYSSVYKQVVNAVNEGKLVPEDVVFALLSKRLEEGENGFILDGIPRTRLQAEILNQIVDIDLVVNFKCSEEYMLKMSSESEILHIGNSKGVESSLKKLRVYSEQAKSVEDYYSKQKKLLNFQLAGATGDAWQGLLAALHLQYSPINALSSSPKLTA
ncbi:hypothetical protein GOBAR_DD01475 [Gossypium barbadense]|nr:hypothetical protein GOBAR_DD01475 [Gossypium barbadense]